MSADSLTPKFTNRLARETSPYLQQHQHNPVDWYPWGDDAFERARRENKPIFLSVGYSTCYWCHVMERECFENEAIARLMDEHFVCIKVDREERPDVDQLYMTAVQVMTGQGGWPMSVWLTPDLRPFYGGTYFPPRDYANRPGFPRVLEALAEAWRERHDDIEKSAADLTRAVQAVAKPQAAHDVPLDLRVIDRLVLRSIADYEPRFGGFGHAPKFPRQTLLRLLVTWLEDRAASPEADQARRQLRHTLDAMANGGIRDHLGGGFHRYSTDAQWLVPHFEIMLYDQAMLAGVYARASKLFDEPRYATVARGICDFVLRDMTGENGEFYTAFDAEVDHREGLNYLWTPEEVRAVLGDDADRFNAIYGLDEGPNFADPHHSGGVPDKNILHLPHGPAEESDRAIIEMRYKLRLAREQRKQPLLDTKILTSWNALMIEALAICGRVLDEPLYVDGAQRAVDCLLRQHRREDGTFCRTSRDGRCKYDGFLDDYAYLALALLELHTTTRDLRWRREADEVAAAMLGLFGEGGAPAGGLYFTSADAKDLIARQKTASDSPLPSGNAAAGLTMLALGRDDAAQSIVSAFSKQISDYAESMSALLETALHLARRQSPDVPRIEPDALPRIGSDIHSLVSLTAHRTGERRIEVNAVIDPRYHINDTNIDPAMDLHATRLRVEAPHADLVDFIDYPPAELLQLPYGPPIAAYAGNVQMSVTFVHALPAEPIRLSLSFQACDDTTCLRPTVVTLTV